MPLSNDEFNTMFEQMIEEMADPHTSYDTLFLMAEKVLRQKVTCWCGQVRLFRGRGLEDDIMQDIKIRLMLNAVNGFLMRKDRGGELNADPDGFKRWMVTVAKNYFRDALGSAKAFFDIARPFDEGEEDIIPDRSYEDAEAEDARRDKLEEAFGIVLGSDKKAYIVLTWLALSLWMIERDVTKIEATCLIEAELSEKTLFEIRDIVLESSKNVDWINIGDEQLRIIDSALKEKYIDKPIGCYKYKTFYMEKGGKASISDWYNRMNSLIKRIMGYE